MLFYLFTPKLRGRWRERFGFYCDKNKSSSMETERLCQPADVRLSQDSRKSEPAIQSVNILVQAASAGDVAAVYPMLKELKKKIPSAKFVFSTQTRSGLAMAGKLSGAHQTIFTPFEVRGAVKNLFDYFQPQILILEYTELWPLMIWEARRRGCPVVINNLHLSSKRLKGYSFLFKVTGNLLEMTNLVLSRTEMDASLAQELGVTRKKVIVTGNSKYDNLVIRGSVADCVSGADEQKLNDFLSLSGWQRGENTVVVFGSIHTDEEDRLIVLCRRLHQRFDHLRFLVAPRYPERARKIKEKLTAQGIITHLLTGLRQKKSSQPREAIIIDTIGELATLYGAAQLAIIGGSFCKRGGQNPLEAAAWGLPILFGPYMDNFILERDLLLQGGAIMAADMKALEKEVSLMLMEPERTQRFGDKTREQIKNLTGTSLRNAELICRLWNNLA